MKTTKLFTIIFITTLLAVSAFGLRSTMTIDEINEPVNEETVSYDGIQSNILVDELVYPEGKSGGELTGSKGFVHKPYYDLWGNVSLDIYISRRLSTMQTRQRLMISGTSSTLGLRC